MKIKSYTHFLFFVFSIVFLTVNSSQAQALAEPQKIIEDASKKLKQRIQDKTFTQDFKKITEFVDEVIYPHMDFEKISRGVLGKLWRKATPEEKAAFTEQFKTLLVRTYSRAFVEFKDWSIDFLPLDLKKEVKTFTSRRTGKTIQKVVVRTQILQPGQQPIPVDYRMYKEEGGDWKVYDIIIGGVSLVTNYRTTFKNEYKQTGSLKKIIENLAKRNKEAFEKSANAEKSA
ncbi:MlaC/ttg2D family ABC transporter substrate-binding protein [methane-oxidizing endosymbiont of Gigantopelta aegis]|uniref:MlaC/ttg2D family ABC transporter substrate-binding protein n=1 Tax=methane-oxidizing endosymbiont of Gigantopelta aegis TaxID=2794938 RepID=UPI0018DCEA06|nr:ABC transporter substrate-binding protein [methane-oxidizing endosymbiont of Gigantopelta aegis]